MPDGFTYLDRVLTSIGAGGATAALLVYLYLRYGRTAPSGTPLVPPAILRQWLDEQRDRLRDMEHMLEQVHEDGQDMKEFLQACLPEMREQTRLLRQIVEHLPLVMRWGRMSGPGS